MKIFDGFPLVSFLILAGILTGRILFLHKKGIKVSSKSREKSNKIKFLFPVFGLIFLVWLFEIINPVFQLSISVLPKIFTKWLCESFLLQITGAVLIVLSITILTITLIHFDRSLRFGLDKNNPGKLITSGIFSISRNPFFLSLDIYFLGIALIFPSLFFICFAILTIVSIHIFILKEEKFLWEVYGEEYQKYTKKVKRYFTLFQQLY